MLNNFTYYFQYFGFENPWVLTLALALPILWWFLSVTPPPPKNVRFPAIILLAGLLNKNQSSDKAPWWLVVMRLFLVLCIILAFADPKIRDRKLLDINSDTLLIIENNWAAAENWKEIQNTAMAIADEVASNGKNLVVFPIFTPRPSLQDAPHTSRDFTLISAQEAKSIIGDLQPIPTYASYKEAAKALTSLQSNFPSNVVWLSNGILDKDETELAALFEGKGRFYIFEPESFALPLSLTL
ncbi:MAG: BatA domain-containing protein, partial [Alphaproteobacteria bacterium]|nr:BatA domain-containing protein [Alphaproteobacteria bacterium]